MLNHLHFAAVILIVVFVNVVVVSTCLFFFTAVVHYNFFCRQLQDPCDSEMEVESTGHRTDVDNNKWLPIPSPREFTSEEKKTNRSMKLSQKHYRECHLGGLWFCFVFYFPSFVIGIITRSFSLPSFPWLPLRHTTNRTKRRTMDDKEDSRTLKRTHSKDALTHWPQIVTGYLSPAVVNILYC